MRIAFNARVLGDSALRGWNRYALNLISGLVELGQQIHLYSDRPFNANLLAALPLHSLVLRQSAPMNYLLWEQIWLARQCSADRIDVLHSPVHFGLPQFTAAKTVLTLHDAIEEVYYSGLGKTRSFAQRITGALTCMARKRADHIVTVSEFSRHDLIRHLKVPESKLSVTYAAADARFHLPISNEERRRVRVKYSLPPKFVFYVGSLEQRKNLPFLLKALWAAHLPDLHVVLGGGNEAERGSLQHLASALKLGERVLTIGRVPDEDLPALYAEAQAFVYPSEYEGFGLQICEAMAVGCPVLVARATCLPEILGFGGESFSLDNPHELVSLLHLIHRDSAFREDLRRRARLRSRAFSWEQTARQTLAVYHALCAGAPAVSGQTEPSAPEQAF